MFEDVRLHCTPKITKRQSKSMRGHGMRCKTGKSPLLKSNMAWVLVNMHNSVFLPLWDKYELYGRKVLHIESLLAIESENLVRISTFFV